MKLNKKEETYRYTFSIIIPIYNVEDYLSEAIESIINQTISFENEVQIILVNDGSLDNCDEICKKYSAMYPNNITYLHKENGGVSSARNLGIEHAEGKYLNFLDPDDILESNVLEHMKVFFSKNNDIKLAAMPLHFFGSQTGEHILNTKFDKERVVDINVNTRDFILHGPAVFIHREAIGASRFPLGKKYGEDSQFIIEIVMNLKKYGLVPEAKYYYRKRFDGTSALNNGPEDIDFYIRHLEDFIALLEKYRDDKTGIIPMYIQNFVMYDVQWRIVFKETPQVLKEYIDKYTQLLFEIVSRIDSIVINSQKNLNWYQRNALLGLKHGAKDLEYGQSSLHGDEYVFENFWGEKLGSSGKYAVTLDNFDYCDEKVNISGFIHGSYFSNDMTSAIISMSNGTEVPAETFEYRRADTYLLGQKIHEYCGFKVSIDKKLIEDSKYFSVHIKTGGFISEKATVQFRGHFVKASDQVKNAYLVADKKAISYCKKEMQFNIVPYSIKTLLKYELGNRIAFFQQKKKDANLITFTRLYAR